MIQVIIAIVLAAVLEYVFVSTWVNLKLKEAERQGGIKAFPLAQKDILETMQDDLDKKAEELANTKLSELLVAADISNVITIDKAKGIMYIGGERAEESRVKNLKSEAEALSQFDLWKVIHDTPKAISERAMFMDDGILPNQLLKGRAILYTLDTQKKIVEMLRDVQIKEN